MLLHLQNVQLDIGITQEVDAVALADILFEVIDWIMDIRGRVRLIIGAIRILHWNSGVHGQCCIEQSVVAPFLVYLTGRE